MERLPNIHIEWLSESKVHHATSSIVVFNKEAKSWLILKEFMEEIIKPGYEPYEIVTVIQPDKSSSHFLPVSTNSWHLTDGSNKVLPTHAGISNVK